MARLAAVAGAVLAGAASVSALVPVHPSGRRSLSSTTAPSQPGPVRNLTPLLEAGASSEEIRAYAKVVLPNVSITSYAGYFTVNVTDNANAFFWYFSPSNASAPPDAPTIAWLQVGRQRMWVWAAVSVVLQHTSTAP
jgi:hypothetical protein